MEFSELISERYSVRAYRPVPVEDEKLQKVLEAARLAPTAANRQPVHLIVVHTEGREEELKRVYKTDWFVEAPLVICVCTTPSRAWVRRSDSKIYADVDAAIVMDHLVLAATDLGLGTCWVGAFNPDSACKIVGIPVDAKPIVFVTVGYANDRARPKVRKPIDELVRYEYW